MSEIESCTLATCDISDATVDYAPNLGGNLFYLIIFAVFFIIHGGQLYKYRTWSYSCSMMSGLVLEVVGYLGRVQMHYNPFLSNPFLLYIICLTIGPVFFTAAVYLILSRIILHYGPQHSRFTPKFISLSFMISDFIALFLQACGGAIADTASTPFGSQQGTWIMVAGLSFQVLSLLVFIAIAAEFAWNVRSSRKYTSHAEKNVEVNGHSASSFKTFLWALIFATIFILTRSSFRVAELARGFDSPLANDEISFMVLEGAMIVLATALMTVFHPGHAFGANWVNAGWSWKKAKNAAGDVEAEQSSGSGEGSLMK